MGWPLPTPRVPSTCRSEGPNTILTVPWPGGHPDAPHWSRKTTRPRNETREHIMWKKVAIVGASAAIIGGAGSAAFAASGTAAPTPSPASTSAPSGTSSDTPKAQNGKRAGVNQLHRAVHATWVTENKKTRTFTTH